MRTDVIKSPQIETLKGTYPTTAQTKGAKASFGDELKKSLDQVIGQQTEADNALTMAANGGADQIHETMIKVEEAELSLRLLMKVRTKALDAYQEVMRMQF